jgi:hypothetical protein
MAHSSNFWSQRFVRFSVYSCGEQKYTQLHAFRDQIVIMYGGSDIQFEEF